MSDRLRDIRHVIADRNRSDVRLHRLAERVHSLGAPAVLHAMIDIAGGADLRLTLERYASLPGDFIRQNGGDRFSRPLHTVTGDAA